MPQTEVLDKLKKIDDYLNSLQKVTSGHIAQILYDVLKIDLHRISSSGEGKKAVSYPPPVMKDVRLSLHIDGRDSSDRSIMSLEKAEVLDLYLRRMDTYEAKDVRAAINMIFGMNLEGIATLENARISLYSKGQWISRTDRDLAAVYTGKGDVDVEIRPTSYYTEKTGNSELPETLQDELKQLGFAYEKENKSFYYCNPAGVSVADEFKTKTMGTIIKGMTRFRDV